MASSGTIFLIVIFISIAEGNAESAFVKVECSAKNLGQHGHQSLLECVVQITQTVTDAKIRVVSWWKEGDDHPILHFNRGRLELQRGYEFAQPSWNEKNMNVSLLITDTVVANEGVYKCMVITDTGDDEHFTTLEVTAKYSAPTIRSVPEKITANSDSVLICNSDGGYPQGRLRWFDQQSGEWTKSSTAVAKRTDSGLFQLSSNLTLLRGSTFPKYTCVVYNASGGKEDEAAFEIPPTAAGHGDGKELDQASKIVAPVVVIGSLTVGLLLALLLYKKRSQQARRHSATPLMAGHQGVPESDYDVEEGDHHHQLNEKRQDVQA